MIRVNNTYCINVDPLNYIVCKDAHKKDKHGRDVMNVVGYLETLSKALEFIIKRSDSDVLTTAEEISLREAIDRLDKNHSEMVELIRQAVPNVHVNLSNSPIRS